MGFKIGKILKKVLDPTGLVQKAAGKGWLGPMAEMVNDKLINPESKGSAAAPAAEVPSALDSAEAQELAARRLARLSKYFTSPLGILSDAATGSQKVFS